MTKLTRRSFIQATAAAAPAWLVLDRIDGWQRPDPWGRANDIVRRIVLPTFPSRDFDITAFGAVADGGLSRGQPRDDGLVTHDGIG